MVWTHYGRGETAPRASSQPPTADRGGGYAVGRHTAALTTTVTTNCNGSPDRARRRSKTVGGVLCCLVGQRRSCRGGVSRFWAVPYGSAQHHGGRNHGKRRVVLCGRAALAPEHDAWLALMRRVARALNSRLCPALAPAWTRRCGFAGATVLGDGGDARDCFLEQRPHLRRQVVESRVDLVKPRVTRRLPAAPTRSCYPHIGFFGQGLDAEPGDERRPELIVLEAKPFIFDRRNSRPKVDSSGPPCRPRPGRSRSRRRTASRR